MNDEDGYQPIGDPLSDKQRLEIVSKLCREVMKRKHAPTFNDIYEIAIAADTHIVGYRPRDHATEGTVEYRGQEYRIG